MLESSRSLGKGICSGNGALVRSPLEGQPLYQPIPPEASSFQMPNSIKCCTSTHPTPCGGDTAKRVYQDQLSASLVPRPQHSRSETRLSFLIVGTTVSSKSTPPVAFDENLSLSAVEQSRTRFMSQRWQFL